MNINHKINSSSLNSAKLMIEELSNRYNYKENLFNTLSENLRKQQRLSDSLNLAIKRINKNSLNSRLSTIKEIQESSSFLLSENLKIQHRLSDSLNVSIKRINEKPLNSLLSTAKEIQKSGSFSLSENLKNQDLISDSLKFSIRRVNEYYLNSFSSITKEIEKSSTISSIRSYNKMISEALKFDNIKIPVELISLELPKIEDVIIVSKLHMPEKIQEEIELEFD